MVILGLGTNVGNRLQNLRNTLNVLQAIPEIDILKISAIYESDALLPKGAPQEWDMKFYNMALMVETSMPPLQFLKLTKKIEQQIGRVKDLHWAPRLIDIDLLAWDELTVVEEGLTIPHAETLNRPFALWPLRELVPDWVHPLEKKTAAQLCDRWGSILTGDTPFHTTVTLKRCDTPQLVGIINLSDDSFTGDGVTASVDAVVARAQQLYKDGAEILDFGAQSTGPDATAVSAEKQWQRLQPVLTELTNLWQNTLEKPLLSVDTTSAIVAEKSLAAGADWVNDVSAAADENMLPLIAKSGAPYVMTHNLGVPAARDKILDCHKNPVRYLQQWFSEKTQELLEQGVAREQIIFDIGVCFGKSAPQSLDILHGIEAIKELGCPVMVGHSRKSICSSIKPLTNAEKDLETTTVSTFLATKKIPYLRVHAIAEHLRALSAFGKLQQGY